MKNLLIVFFLLLFLIGCSQQTTSVMKEEGVINIIFETDMGNDIDDALALDMLYKYADQGRINLMAICINKDNPYPARFVDIMNTWYGYPDIPVGIVRNGTDDPVPVNFAKEAVEYRFSNGDGFKGTGRREVVPEATALYRKQLAAMPDRSVVIISVGYFTNLARLLDSTPDTYSPLSGKDLVAQKVKLLSLMGGNFVNPEAAEYNVEKDIASAKQVMANWPGEIIVSPFEVGEAILFPGEVIENRLPYAQESPLSIAYKSYLPMPYDRPGWDLTSVLCILEEEGGYFSYSPKGTVTVLDNGAVRFAPDDKGLHRYLKVTREQGERVRDRFVELVTTPPAVFR